LFLVELPLQLFGVCLRGAGRVAEQQWLLAGQSVARMIAALVWLRAGGGLPGMVLLLGAINLATSATLFLRLKRLGPSVSLAPRRYDAVLARELREPGRFFFLLQLSGAIVFCTDPLVISAMLGTEQVAAYGVAQRIVILASSVVATV